MSERSSTGQPPKYVTPAEVRAIPNEQWEEWIGRGYFPITEFDPSCLKTAATILSATRRRMEAAERG